MHMLRFYFVGHAEVHCRVTYHPGLDYPIHKLRVTFLAAGSAFVAVVAEAAAEAAAEGCAEDAAVAEAAVADVGDLVPVTSLHNLLLPDGIG